MNIGSAIVLLAILGLLVLAVRHAVRRGPCDRCDGNRCGRRGACDSIPWAPRPNDGDGVRR